MDPAQSKEVLAILTGIFWLVLIMMTILGAGSVISAFRNSGESASSQNRQLSFQAKQLHFAAVTLTGLGFIFVIAMSMYYFGAATGPGKEIFETSTTVLPPIITLILGFYFGQEKAARESDQNNAQAHELDLRVDET